MLYLEYSLEGKVALITGGASGIGESIARLFHKHGAKVCIADLQDSLGQIVCESLDGESNACFVHCDVTNEEDVSHAVDFTVEKFGTVDILVNNAGVGGSKVTDIRNADFNEFKKVVDVNLNGTFLGMKHAARIMIPRGKGSIISMASVASVLGGLGPHSYTSSKHAILGLTKSVAAELGKHGIRVNCVSPYAVPTKLSMPYLPEGQRHDDLVKSFLAFAGSNANLKGLDLLPDDVAQSVLFLASDDSNYVSALNLTVDGGFTSIKDCFQAFD